MKRGHIFHIIFRRLSDIITISELARRHWHNVRKEKKEIIIIMLGIYTVEHTFDTSFFLFFFKYRLFLFFLI